MVDTLKGGQEQHTDEGGRITRGRDWGLKLYTTEPHGDFRKGRDTKDSFLETTAERGTAMACMRI